MDKILITVSGFAGIALVYWFFFGKKEEVSMTTDIVVDGGYKPSVIQVPVGKTTTLTFTRKDPSSCLEEVIIEDLKVKKFLPMNTPVTISVSPTTPGTYGMHCGMNMFHGKIIVV